MNDPSTQRKLTREEELELWRASRAKSAKREPPKPTSAARNPTPVRRSFFALGPSNVSTSFSSSDSGTSQPVKTTTRPSSATRASTTNRAPTPVVGLANPRNAATSVQNAPLSLMEQTKLQAKANRAAKKLPTQRVEKPVQNISPTVETAAQVCHSHQEVQTMPPPETCEIAVQASLGNTGSTVAEMREIVAMAKEDIARVNFVNAVLELRVQELETQTTRDMIDNDSYMDDIREKHRKDLKRVTQEKQNIQRQSEEMLAGMQRQLTEGLDVALKRIEELEVDLQIEKELRKAAEMKYQQTLTALRNATSAHGVQRSRVESGDEGENEYEEDAEDEDAGDDEDVDEHDDGEEEQAASEDSKRQLSRNISGSSLYMSRSHEVAELHHSDLSGDLSGAGCNEDGEESEDEEDDNSTECASSDTDEHQDDIEVDEEPAVLGSNFLGLSPIKSNVPPLQVHSPTFGGSSRSSRRSTLCGTGRRSESPENKLDFANAALEEPELEKKAEMFSSLLDFDDDDDFAVADEDEEPNAQRIRRRQSSIWRINDRKSLQVGSSSGMHHNDVEASNRRFSHM